MTSIGDGRAQAQSPKACKIRPRIFSYCLLVRARFRFLVSIALRAAALLFLVLAAFRAACLTCAFEPPSLQSHRIRQNFFSHDSLHSPQNLLGVYTPGRSDDSPFLHT